MIKQAMIFAAGMGKRMLPITETTPKPLVKINQDSLLVNNIKKLIKSNFNSIVINAFHFPEKIIAEVKDYKNHVKVVIEEERLETGGGLLNCLKKNNLSWESPILLLNSDVYWIDNFHSTIELILENWNPEFMDLVLCMKKKRELYGYSGKGDFNLYKKKSNYQKLIFSDSPDLVFTGLQLINPKILIEKKEKIFSFKEIIMEGVKREKAYGIIDKNPWFHIGTVKDLKSIRKLIL